MFDPYHIGEREVQERVGERHRAVLLGRAIATSIMTGARAFVAQQHYMAAGWASHNDDLWASVFTGAPGFCSTNADGTSLNIDLPAQPLEDSVPGNPPPMRLGDKIGALYIELSTRRRLRVNGVIAGRSGHKLTVEVLQSFPNCPKYIQRRDMTALRFVKSGLATEGGDLPAADVFRWVADADTFFVASRGADGLMDVSHRGGNPGFVKIEGNELHIPDYVGNSMFSTLGNILVNPRIGLTFVDFGRNRQLHLTGEARLELDAGDRWGETGGTGRWWAFAPSGWVVRKLDPEIDWAAAEMSPFNP